MRMHKLKTMINETSANFRQVVKVHTACFYATIHCQTSDVIQQTCAAK